MTYYFYENWRVKKDTFVHLGTCGSCNEGRGLHNNLCGETENGKWHGPFQD